MPANVTQSATATFAFTANEAATFTCRLDLRPAVPCRSPQTYTGLSLGRHVFQVWARDLAGNVEAKPRALAVGGLPAAGRRPLRVAAVGDIHPPSRSAEQRRDRGRGGEVRHHPHDRRPPVPDGHAGRVPRGLGHATGGR